MFKVYLFSFHSFILFGLHSLDQWRQFGVLCEYVTLVLQCAALWLSFFVEMKL